MLTALAVLGVARAYFPFERLLAVATGEASIIPRTEAGRGETTFWWVLGAIFLAGALFALERMHPYYFSQDDALVAELPGMLEGCRSVWHGVWPEYDPCRLMGGPLAPEGVFSLTYPPTYLCYAIAHDLLHDDFALLEIFAVMHLAVGYAVMWLLCSRVGMRPLMRCCCALCFLLSGSILIIGRGWHTFLPLVVWLPLMMVGIERLAAGPVGLPWAIGMGIAGGILFHVGFPQLWVYSMLFVSLAGIWLTITGLVPWRRLIWGVIAGLIAVGIATPLLVTELDCTLGVARPPPYYFDVGITSQWIAALLPYPLVQVLHPIWWGSTDLEVMGHLYFFGGVFALGFLIGIIAVFSRRSRRAWGRNQCLFCAAVAFVLCMGDRGGLFTALGQIPMLKNVNDYPFRALPFFVIFATIGAGLFLDRLLAAITRGRALGYAIAVLILCLMAYHVRMARASFYTYNFQPYPHLPRSITRRIEGAGAGRMMSWSTLRSISPVFPDTLPLDLPMLYDVKAFGGYDPLLEWRDVFNNAENHLAAAPAEALRGYGVRWHLISPLTLQPVVSFNPGVVDEETQVKYLLALNAIRPSLKLAVHAHGVWLCELDGVDPMAFSVDRPGIALPIRTGGDGIRVNLRRLRAGATVIVNFLWSSQMRASINGRLVPVGQDDLHRMVIAVPPGARQLHLYYAAPWAKGCSIGSCIVLLALGGGWVMQRQTALRTRRIRPAR